MLEKHLICISCPIGCELSAGLESDDSTWKITGNRCPRGEAYALAELTDPRRVVTAVVRSNSPVQPLLPVRTDQPLPKRFIDRLLNHLYTLTVKTPVKCGDVLIDNVENSGVRVIFSCDCEK